MEWRCQMWRSGVWVRVFCSGRLLRLRLRLRMDVLPSNHQTRATATVTVSDDDMASETEAGGYSARNVERIQCPRRVEMSRDVVSAEGPI